MGKMPEAQNFLIPPRMFKPDSLKQLINVVLETKDSVNTRRAPRLLTLERKMFGKQVV